KLPRFRWLSPGGIVAVVVWVVASGLFACYVANFGSYNKTYGTPAGVIIFLVWMWITNLAILLGAEFNAGLQRGRELGAGERKAELQIQLPPRDTPKRKRGGALNKLLARLHRDRKDEPARREPEPVTTEW